jgi:uncharacterized phage-associated protein
MEGWCFWWGLWVHFSWLFDNHTYDYAILTNSMKIPLIKLKAILLYFANNTDTKFLGKVKLMKLFYFLDFKHLKKFGSPVTFDTYVNLDHGPIPSFIKNIVDSAADDIDSSVLADTIYFERPSGTAMFRILPKRKFTDSDMNLFSETELEVLNQICVEFGNRNTKYLEDASHKESPWRDTVFLQKIPYSYAAKDADCAVTAEEIELLSQI